MNVRPLALKDIKPLALLHQQAFFKGWSEESFQELLKSPCRQGLVSHTKNEISGFILWQKVEPEAEILTLVVSEPYQRQGVGSFLLESLTKVLEAHSVSSLFLEVAEDNFHALSFYKKHGFQLVGKRPNYYARPHNKYSTAFTFVKNLDKIFLQG